MLASMRTQAGALTHRVAGDLEGAERLGREGIGMLERMGERGYRSTAAAYLAEVLVLRGDDAGAEEMVRVAAENTATDDFLSVVLLARVRGRLLARRGDIDAALPAARQAVAITEASDYLVEQAEARMSLAAVLEAAGRPADAAAEVALAIERYRGKGAVALVERARAELARLRGLVDPDVASAD